MEKRVIPPAAGAKRLFRRLIAWTLCLVIPGLSPAQETGDFPLRPGAIYPAPLQRGINEIESVPTREAVCPVCGRTVSVPLADKLMRSRPNLAGVELRWEMHAESRDADQAPFPGKNKLAYQADIVACPDCGFAAPADAFEQPLPPALAAWAAKTLRPNMRLTQTLLLGKRAQEMSEEEIIEFFNRQEEIPDIVRTEHYRIYAQAANLPRPTRAEATWLAAWALRRSSAGPAKSDFLRARQRAVETALAKTGAAPNPEARIAALRRLTGKTRAGKDRLGYADRFAARLMLAGLFIRQGLTGLASDQLETMLRECQDRFLKPEQDPLWPSTSVRASRVYRLNELETIRSEMEEEIAVRLEQTRLETALLEQAATLLREAILAGECPDRDHALFYAYLIGEFLRRADRLPLSAEWFSNLAVLADPDAPVARAAAQQLALLHRQAGNDVNLLSALGQDGDALVKLREICAPDALAGGK